jgi:hypothetical protein
MFLMVLEVVIDLHIVTTYESIVSYYTQLRRLTTCTNVYRGFLISYRGCEVTNDGFFIDRQTHSHHCFTRKISRLPNLQRVGKCFVSFAYEA